MATLLGLQSHLTFPKTTVKPFAVLNQTHKMRVPFELKQGQNRRFHQLPSGLNMEVIEQKRERSDKPNPPLVFVHGSYHAAWCWAEHWLPFFSASGFDCYAVSLLGQGESDAPPGTVAGSLQTHADDVADFIEENLSLPPVLLGHSFGGLIIQNYIARLKTEQSIGNLLLRHKEGRQFLAPTLFLCWLGSIPEMKTSYPELGGAVLVCSVPPSGNSGLVWRYLFTKPIAAFKVTRSLAAKAFQTDLSLCKETFFSSTMEDHLVLRFVHGPFCFIPYASFYFHAIIYQELMKESSRMPLFDLRKLNASLPVPSVPKSSIEVLVLGAKDDFIVDAKGLSETGEFYGVSPVCVEGVAHDMMLDCSWEKGAAIILSWLDGLSR
ncbi:hypothetical protein Patl1_21447 [Pistacia atlantica]|uniref:Uncharacterized protein n=1 Tax=Pistacia atlantica TaxID=434234 RepID=A0ACC1BLV1_9ROSI|nr:hypothetical protein Patl1_21447 [Pistacia atlantica]